MNKATRMLVYIGLTRLAVFVGLTLAWYVTTRNVEVARYEVIEADGAIEIRSYPALVVAEVTRTGNRDEAVRSGFGPLAGYIFAKERPGDKIAMTAPVTQSSEGTNWTVRFIMPSSYTLDQLPRPSDADVQLRELPPVRRAVIRFSGWWSDELFETEDAKLRDWLSKKGLRPLGTPTSVASLII
ncbi:heme-binding protein [Aestuariivirga sp.]|uniref:SOUL family heme-binding protein n=1 Tax=Aestuariivirga sp. TaxID=2650926 RepID=UPI003593717E